MEKTHVYAEEDWIVHTRYGIGQIQGIDLKNISGKKTRYYRIKASNSTFWIPVDQMDSDVLRPLSTPEDIEKAIAALKNPPEEMSQNYKTRQSRIQKVQIRNTPRAVARLIRDLRERQRKKGVLNKTERDAFRTLTQRLVEEWALVTGIQKESVESRLNRLLNPGLAANSEQSNGALMPGIAAASTGATRQRSTWRSWPKRQTNRINR